LKKSDTSLDDFDLIIASCALTNNFTLVNSFVCTEKAILDASDAVMQKVDVDGNVIGFSILKISAIKEKELLNISLRRQAA